jgi:hypothetical protein
MLALKSEAMIKIGNDQRAGNKIFVLSKTDDPNIKSPIVRSHRSKQ